MNEHALFYLIWFVDSDVAEGQCLHIGTKEDCEHLEQLMPAVSYSGNRTPLHAAMFIRPNIGALQIGQRIHVTPPVTEEQPC